MAHEGEDFGDDDLWIGIAEGKLHKAIDVAGAPCLNGEDFDQGAGFWGAGTPLHLECGAETFEFGRFGDGEMGAEAVFEAVHGGAGLAVGGPGAGAATGVGAIGADLCCGCHFVIAIHVEGSGHGGATRFAGAGRRGRKRGGFRGLGAREILKTCCDRALWPLTFGRCNEYFGEIVKNKTKAVLAKAIETTPNALVLVMDSGRVSIPSEKCSERLARASRAEREHAELSPSGYGIRWPLIDEDLAWHR